MFGPAIPIYATLLFFAVSSFTYATIKKFKTAKGIAKAQIYLVSTGLGFTMVFGLFTNFLLVILAQTSSFIVFGPTFGLVLAAFVFVAIIRHKLFDIRVILGRIIYYAVLALLPFSIFFILVYFYVDVFGSVFSLPVYLLSIPVAVGFVLMFNWINDILRNQVTTRLINPGYNPLETAERLSNELSVMIELPPIANAITSTLSRTVRPDFSAIVILPDEKHAADRTYTSDNRALADLTKLKLSLIHI